MAPPGNGDDRIQIGSPAGGGYTTVNDMLRFARAVTGHRLLCPELTETVLTGKVTLNPLGWSTRTASWTRLSTAPGSSGTTAGTPDTSASSTSTRRPAMSSWS